MPTPSPRPFRIEVDQSVLDDLQARLTPRALARRAAGRALGLRHQRRVHAGAGRLLARPLRLARAGGASSTPSASSRCRCTASTSISSTSRARARTRAAAALARLAGLGLRVPRDHPAADRPRALRRRPGRRVHRGRALAARLRPLVRARAAALRRRGDRRLLRRADDRRARLRRFAAQGGDWGAFVTARLGYAHAGPADRHSPQPHAGTARPTIVADPTPEEQPFLDELALG